jgi:hypothetical protein
MPAKDLERGSTSKLIPSQKTPTPMSGNISYNGLNDKGFPAEIEGLPGFSSASSCCTDECSPGELIRGGSRGPDALRYPGTVVPVVKTPGPRDSGHAPGGAEVLPWWYETGTGHVKDTCGNTLKTVAACNNHPGSHKPLLIPDSCGRASCPVCWETWAERAGARVRDSLEGYLSIVHGNSQRPLPGLDKRSLRARHITFSPPRYVVDRLVKETLQETDAAGFQRVFLQKFQRLAIATVREAGLTAGVLIVHGIRLKKSEDADAADKENNTNRYREILDSPDWRDNVLWYPHVHVLGYGFLDDSGDFYERTHWIYRTLRVVDEPERVVKYLLSHAPSVTNRCAYVRFGRMNSRHMVKVKEYCCREYIPCEECLEAGVPEDQATRVIARLADDPDGRPDLQCENDKDRGARLRSRGRGDPVSWAFETVSKWKYSRVHRRCVYRRRDPGDPAGSGYRHRPPDSRVYSELGYARVNLDRFRDRREWVGPEKWDHLVESGVISSWYEGVV